MKATVRGVLESRAVEFVGMVLLTYVFWRSGFSKLLDFAGASDEMAHFGLMPPALFAAATIALQLGASAVIIFFGRWAWLAAGALAFFTLATIPVAHDFWNQQGHAAFLEQAFAQEHITVIGGLVLAAILGQRSARIQPHSISLGASERSRPAR